MNNAINPEQQKHYGEAFLLTEADREEMADICKNSDDWTTIMGAITFLQKKRLQDEGNRILNDLEQTKKSEHELKAYVKKLEKESSQLNSHLIAQEDEIQSLKQIKGSCEDKIKILEGEKDEIKIALKKEKAENESLKSKLKERDEDIQNIKSQNDQLLNERLQILEAHQIYNMTFDRLKPAQKLGDSPRNPIMKRKTPAPHADDSGCSSPCETSIPDQVSVHQKRVQFELTSTQHTGPTNFFGPKNHCGSNKRVPAHRNLRLRERQ